MKGDHVKTHNRDRELDAKDFNEIKVIGAGLPRTGTMSLKTALTQLYGGKCYHMMNVFLGDQEDINTWIKAERGEMTSEDWRGYFGKNNYACGVDFPFSFYYKDIMKAYPEAKVVLSVRDPKTWWTSVYYSIWEIDKLFARHPFAKWMVGQMDRRRPTTHDMHDGIALKVPEGCHTSLKEAIEGGPEVSERFFNEWVEEVKRSVPADRLLIHSAKEGWPPLCEFLGLPVPDNSYPRVNDTAQIRAMVRKVWVMNCILFYCLPVTAAVAAGYLYRSELTPVVKTCQEVVLGWICSLTDKLKQ